MKSFFISTYKYVLTIALLILTGCSVRKQTFQQQQIGVADEIFQPGNLSVCKNGVIRYYESGRFAQEVKLVIDEALSFLQSFSFKDRDIAIFDIDDTLLWSYADSKAIQFGFVPKLFHEWVIKAVTPEVPEVRRLYDFCCSHPICKVVLLTGRRYDEVAATLKNFDRLALSRPDTIIARESHELHETAYQYKLRHRKDLESRGFRIVLCVGDQYSDLEGGHVGHAVKVPNYIYEIE